MKTRFGQKQSGSTLAVVIITMALLIVIVAAATEYTTTVNRHVQRANMRETAIAVGDSCMEILFANWRTTCRATPNSSPPPSTSSFAAVATPSPGQFPTLVNLPAGAITSPLVKRGPTAGGTPNPDPQQDDYDSSYTISNYKVVAVSPEFTALPAATPGANSTPVPSANATPLPVLGQLSSAITTILPTTSGVYNYIASADVTLPALGNRASGGAGGGNVVAKIRRVFQKQQMSPLDFAIFYVDPLEIHPGPAFTVTGRVHTNSDLWTGHNTLTFADTVTFGSNWAVDFMTGDSTHPETPEAPNYPAGMPPAHVDPFELPIIGNVSNANTASGYHEIIEPPNTSVSDPYASQRYYDQAGIIITVNASNQVTIGQGNGSGGYTMLTATSGTTAQKALFNMFNGAITTGTTIQDNREGASVRLVKLDVSKLTTNKVNGVTVAGTNGVVWGTSTYDATNSFNGIVYIYDNSATSSVRRGVELINGQTIPGSGSTPGLTVASQNPVYIQGDFNTGGTGNTVPSNNPSNLNSDGTYKDPANPPAPQVSGYTRVPTSVLADAVNILSSNWNDANSGAALSSRPAAATTVNAAIVSGNVQTNTSGDGDYSGGAENFPRFLEDWTSKPLNYYGSMVELYQSQQSVGEWHYGGNIYNAPARNWFYDNNFKTIRPPGSVMAMVVTYTKGRWTVQ